MIDVEQLTALHRDMVIRWHQQEVDNPYEGVMQIICTQHSFNFKLWHEEDIARSPNVGDVRIAQVKRAIDKLNQQRNDWIEKVDDWISEYLDASGVQSATDATLNTETPGSVIDRLSIMSLRIYHLEEQTERTDVDQQHVESVHRKIAVCGVQQHDLTASLAELLGDIHVGRKQHKTYRQFKMYNDPSLNPYLYAPQNRKAG